MEDKIYVEKFEIDVGDTGHITNCYFVKDSANSLCIIDPADKANEIISKIEKENLKLKAVIITHCHSDHICAVSTLIKKYKDIKVFMSQVDIPGLNDTETNCAKVVGVEVPNIDENRITGVKDGDTLQIEDMSFRVISTPGHTKGSIILYEKNLNVLFTGDTVFSNTYGRTDLKMGSHDDMRHSLDKIFASFDDVKCFPGHGEDFILSQVKRKINLLFAYKG